MKICIFGAGAIGGYLAAELALAGQHEVCAIAREHGGAVSVVTDPREAVAGARAVYTDVWVSMGEPAEVWAERIRLLKPYQVNAALMAAAQNPQVKFMHCLPAHRGEEVVDAVIDGPRSIVYDQAENRMHVQKALMEYLLLGRIDNT